MLIRTLNLQLLAAVAASAFLIGAMPAASAKVTVKKVEAGVKHVATKSVTPYTKKGAESNLKHGTKDGKKLVAKHTTVKGRVAAGSGVVKRAAPYIPR